MSSTRFLALAVAATLGCEGGSSTGTADGGGLGKDTTCLVRATLSGGVNATMGDVDQVCAYSERSVAFAAVSGGLSMTLVVDAVERGQTGAFPATLAVRSGTDRWSDAKCTVTIESNEKLSSSDAGAGGFDQYLLRGTGMCTTPATYRSDAGTKEPVTIAPFSFVFTSLFY